MIIHEKRKKRKESKMRKILHTTHNTHTSTKPLLLGEMVTWRRMIEERVRVRNSEKNKTKRETTT